MTSTRLGVVTGTRLGAAFIDGLAKGMRSLTSSDLRLSLLMGLHPSHALTTVGYTDVIHVHGRRFETARYFGSTKAESFSTEVESASLDFLLIISLSQLVPQTVIERCCSWRIESGRRVYNRACVGAHPTCLPVGRGRAPIPWTILKGMTSSAVTTFVIADGVDNGPVIFRHKFQIGTADDAASIYGKVRDLHYDAGWRLAEPLAARSLVTEFQSEETATIWEKRTPKDAYISSACTAEDVRRIVLAAQPPYPRAFIVVRDHILSISAAAPTTATRVAPAGSILTIADEHIVLKVADGVVRLRLVDPLPSEIATLPVDGLTIP